MQYLVGRVLLLSHAPGKSCVCFLESSSDHLFLQTPLQSAGRSIYLVFLLAESYRDRGAPLGCPLVSSSPSVNLNEAVRSGGMENKEKGSIGKDGKAQLHTKEWVIMESISIAVVYSP